VLVSSPHLRPGSLSSATAAAAADGGIQAVQSDRRGGGGGGRCAAALSPMIGRRATVDTARSRSTCGIPRQHDVPPGSTTQSSLDVISTPASDIVEGLGVRTAPDDRQDEGQGSVIVGDDGFKRPVRIIIVIITS